MFSDMTSTLPHLPTDGVYAALPRLCLSCIFLHAQVGGIKEKLLAARAAGLSRALVPLRNMRDVELEAGEATAPHTTHGAADGGDGGETASGRLPREGLQVLPVATLEDVLAAAFDPPYLLRRRSRL
jgi:predicted ATP-dependent protease